MNLSKNFTLEEMTHTATGKQNVPDEADRRNLLYLCQYVLQPIRNEVGALKVTSGYRSAIVNAAVGGSVVSQHLCGEAADVIPLNKPLDEVFKWIMKESGIPFGQCILESSWIHISLVRLDKPNNQVLIIKDGVRTAYV